MSNACIVNDIDYLEYPPPETIYRAMKYEHAIDMIENGKFRFSNLDYYKTIENEDYRDPSEGNGVFIRQGSRCSVGFMNPVYVFCTSTNSNSQKLLNCFKECDTAIQIHDVKKFVEKILSFCRSQGFDGRGFVSGQVCYDKDNGGIRSHWGQEGIFQKHSKYKREEEYRIALYRKNSEIIPDYFYIELGNCSDIVSIIHRT